MQKHDPKPQKKVEFHKLLRFAAVSVELGENIDFQADVIEAKLGEISRSRSLGCLRGYRRPS